MSKRWIAISFGCLECSHDSPDVCEKIGEFTGTLNEVKQQLHDEYEYVQLLTKHNQWMDTSDGGAGVASSSEAVFVLPIGTETVTE